MTLRAGATARRVGRALRFELDRMTLGTADPRDARRKDSRPSTWRLSLFSGGPRRPPRPSAIRRVFQVPAGLGKIFQNQKI
jgi:hypothetical protein